MVDEPEPAKDALARAEVFEFEMECKPIPPGTPRGGRTFSNTQVFEFEMECRPIPPGTPRGGRTCSLPFDEIKHLRSSMPLRRPGDPGPEVRS